MTVFTSVRCLGHEPGGPERSARLAAVHRRIAEDGRFPLVEAPPADDDLLTRCHPPAWIAELHRRADRSLPAGDEVPMSPASWPAVLGAAGAVRAALDHALDHGAAFAAIRPPGHHASAITAMGFCPVNLVATAAALAAEAGRTRALIVDWDVHHGNGTQAIVDEDPDVRFVSMHQYPWYPGTGAAFQRGIGNCFNVPLPPGLPRERYVAELWSAVEAATGDWRPDIVLVSAGYDSLAGDPLGGFTLEPADFAAWIHRLREAWPDRPLVAMMEGGYAPERLADGVLATVEAMVD